MPNDPYESLAERYDWMKQEDPVRKEFFRQLFEKHQVYDVLDCAYGTGIDLVMFYSLPPFYPGEKLLVLMPLRV